MLSLDRVMPLIRHEDLRVVELAMDYLKHVREPEPLRGQFILDAVSAGAPPELYSWLKDFRVDAEVLEFALRTLERRSSGHDQFLPAGVLAYAPDALFTPDICARVGRLKIAINWVRHDTKFRLDHLNWPTERLQERFLKACQEADDAETAMSEQHEIAALVDRLAGRTESHEWAVRLLDDAGTGGWAQIWLVSLLRRARHRRAFDLAMAQFVQTDFDEDDALADEYGLVLSELCQQADLPQLARLVDHAEEDHRIRLIEALGRQRWPEAEQLLTDVARRHTASLERTFAVIGLCEMLADTEDALSLVADVVDGEDFEWDIEDVEDRAIALGIAVGKPFPHAERWEARLGDPQQRTADRQRLRQERYPKIMTLADALQTLRDAGTEHAPADFPGEVPLDVTVTPVARGDRIGRNDPCPCGSGKKYKKCCLNKLEAPKEVG